MPEGGTVMTRGGDDGDCAVGSATSASSTRSSPDGSSRSCDGRCVPWSPLIEDACQFAWWRLVVHAHRVERRAALSWLAKTAVHEALKLIRREERDVSLEAQLDGAGEAAMTEPVARTR